MTPTVTKAELVSAMAENAEMSTASAGAALDAMILAITAAVRQCESVKISGFGTFACRERAARTGINPRTKQIMKIEPSKVPYFKPSRNFKESIR